VNAFSSSNQNPFTLLVVLGIKKIPLRKIPHIKNDDSYSKNEILIFLKKAPFKSLIFPFYNTKWKNHSKAW
jgi:hypothetical protein